MVHIIRTAWAGTSGGAGLTQICVEETSASFGPISSSAGQAAANAVRTMWNAVAGLLPNEVALTVQPIIDTYNNATGDLSWSMTVGTAPLSVTGTATGVFSMAAGAKCNFNTGEIKNGRRVRGAMYLVPAESSLFSNAGLVASTHRATIVSALTTMRSSLASAGLNHVVWSRPTSPGNPKHPREGFVTPIIGYDVNEKGAVLRGRRD